MFCFNYFSCKSHEKQLLDWPVLYIVICISILWPFFLNILVSTRKITNLNKCLFEAAIIFLLPCNKTSIIDGYGRRTSCLMNVKAFWSFCPL